MKFGMWFNGRTDSTKKGFVSNDLNKVKTEAVNQCKKNKAIVIILSGDLSDNYHSFLSSLSSQLYNLGIIQEQKIEQHGLLSLLSGSVSPDTMVRDLTENKYESKSIYYLTGFHQMEYNKTDSDWILNYLQSRLVHNQIYKVLILNIPLCICQYVQDYFPELWNNSIRYVKEVTHKYAQTERPKNQKNYADNGKKIAISDTEDSECNDHPYNAKFEEKPWYMKETSSLAIEKDGMSKLLKSINVQGELSALPISKRLCWKLLILYSTGRVEYKLDLMLIYLEYFSETNPSVGIVIKNADSKLIRAVSNSRYCEETVKTDAEVDKVFIMKEVYKNNNASVAAATLRGFMRLLDSLKPNEVL